MRKSQGLLLGLLITLCVSLWPTNAFVQTAPDPDPTATDVDQPYLVKFNNIQIIEVLRFLSRITGKNFIFNEDEMDFRITLLSEEPSSVENIMAALMQVLRINGFTMLEQGNNIIIHTNLTTKRIPHLRGRGLKEESRDESELVTQVYRLVNVPPATVASLVRALLSTDAQVEVVNATGHLVVTDLATNIDRVTQLIDELDSTRPTLEIGQYLVRNAPVLQLSQLALQILDPIAGEQTLQINPSPATNSIFIVSTPYLVEKTISVLQTLDLTNRQTRIMSLDRMNVVSETVGDGTRELTDDERRALTERQNSERQALKGMMTGLKNNETAASDALKSEIERLIDRIANENLTPEQAEYLRDRVKLLSQMLNAQEEDKAKRIDLMGLRDRLEARRQEVLDHLTQPITEAERAALEEEHSAILAQLNGIDRERRTNRDYFSGRLDELAGLVQELIDNPPPPPAPVTLDIRSDTRGPGFEGLVSELPDIARVTQYEIYKLQHKRADEAAVTLKAIGTTLSGSGDPDIELISTIDSAQPMPATNSVVLSGTPESLERALELVRTIDIPRRQVFVELLILSTTIIDSLNFGVQWGVRAEDQPDWAATAGFFVADSPLPAAIHSSTIGNIDMQQTAGSIGGHLGVVGKMLTCGDMAFSSIGALVRAVQQNGLGEVIMNPKIIVEDETTAEIFVGENTRFKAQTITNEGGDTLSTNFEYRDVGSLMRVTPYIGDGEMIIMEIDQDFSSDTGNREDESEIAQDLGPTTRVSRTTTRVHVPDGHFLVLSGMIFDERVSGRRSIPCLGSIPYLGAIFGDTTALTDRSNLLIFIRPQIIDSKEDMARLNQNQYKLFQQNHTPKPVPDENEFDYDISTGLDFLDVYESAY